MVITLDNVSFKYTFKQLLDNASMSITDQDKVGLIGLNGEGKSTLFKLILGHEKGTGNVIISGNTRISYLPQNPVFNLEGTVLDEIMQYNTKDFPIKDYEAKTVLNKLKLFKHDSVIKTLSGGEKKRLLLAVCLLRPCDFLLLDEPTNHLDMDMIVWLERYLKKWNHGLLLITHDRYFLENVCNKMIELDHGKLFTYEANYSKYLELKADREEVERGHEKKIKNFLREELKWIRRGAQARSTKQKSRIDRFNETNSITFSEEKSYSLSSIGRRLGKKTIEIKDGKKAYGDNLLFENVNLNILPTDRIAVVGKNGAGKSTLFKTIIGEESLDSGTLDIGSTVHIGYFKQEMEVVDLEMTVMDYIKGSGNIVQTVDGSVSASDLLEQFLFTKDKHYTPLKFLSGGEIKRLQLIKVLVTNPNVLILDEPTNDLDIYTIEVLEDFIDNFYGPVLLVSHDRYFVDKVCDTLLVFEDSNVKALSKSISEYIEMDKVSETNEKKKNTRVNLSFPTKLKKELNDLPDLIEKLEIKIDLIKDETSKYSDDYVKLIEIQEEIEQNEEELEIKTNRYFELLEEQEKFDKN